MRGREGGREGRKEREGEGGRQGGREAGREGGRKGVHSEEEVEPQKIGKEAKLKKGRLFAEM